MSIGSVLKILRENKGLNKRQLSEELKMPYTTYNNYETDARDVGSETLRLFANYYGVSIDYLLENEIKKSNQNQTDCRKAVELAQVICHRPELLNFLEVAIGVNDDNLADLTRIVSQLSDKAKD